MKQIIQIVRLASYASAVPAIWIGRRIRGMLWYYAWASFLCDIVSVLLTNFLHHNSHIAGNIFYFLEISLIGVYFSLELFAGWPRRVFLIITAILLLRFASSVITDPWGKVNWSDVSLAMALFVLFCLVALYKVMSNIEHLKIERSPLFIFSAAFLLYASYSLVLMLFADYFRAAPAELRSQLWSIHNVLNVVKNLAIARMFYLQQKALKA